MANNPPVLVVGYNRPEKTAASLKSLGLSEPKILYLAVDGPKPDRPEDPQKVRAVLESVNVIDWDCDVRLIQREQNLGMRFAIPDAVSQVVRQHGSVIVVEDDTIVGKDFVPFCNFQLDRFKNEPSIGHINGYSVVPRNVLRDASADFRLTRFPDSFAWATWARAWDKYEDSMSWSVDVSISDLTKLINSRLGAIHWKMMLNNVAKERISSWAYRWVASLWKQDSWAIAPSFNLVTNKGFDLGSHNITKASWTDPGIQETTETFPMISTEPFQDLDADAWVSRVQNRDTVSGILREALVTVARTFVKENH